MTANLILTLEKDFTWVDTTLQTASWTDTYLVKAGDYPVVFTDIRGNTAADASYYAVVNVDVTLIEQYRVNRLLSESRAQSTILNEDQVHPFRFYGYEILDHDSIVFAISPDAGLVRAAIRENQPA